MIEYEVAKDLLLHLKTPNTPKKHSFGAIIWDGEWQMQCAPLWRIRSREH